MRLSILSYKRVPWHFALFVSILLFLWISEGFSQSGFSSNRKVFTREIGWCGGVTLKPSDTHSVAELSNASLFRIEIAHGDGITIGHSWGILPAVAEWDDLIDSSGFNPGTYRITFQAGLLPSNVLARTTVTYETGTGNLVSSEITINNHPSIVWFFDITPEDDSEFTGENPPHGVDFLSVMRHEVGHAVGWAITKRVEQHLQGNVFDPTLLNIATTFEGGFHSDPDVHNDDLMNPAIAYGIRRPISLYPAAAVVSKAFHYWISSLRCVSGLAVGSSTGSVYQPWPTVEQGIKTSPVGSLLLLRPRTYHENAPLKRSDSLTMMVLRGGTAIIMR